MNANSSPGLPADALEALRHYDIEMFTSWEELPRGIVNTTYKLQTPLRPLLLQRLNKVWDERIIEDYKAIHRNLKDKFPIPPLIRTNDGKEYVRIGDNIWRLVLYVDNETSQTSCELIYNTAKSLAKLHKHLGDFDYEPKFTLKDFHDTPRIVERLKTVFFSDSEKRKQAEDEFDFIIKNIEQHYLPQNQTTIIHGDPKLSNFLFKDNEVITIIDWDTLMRGDPLIDIGDGLRSWCRRHDNTFDEELYRAAIRGYTAENTAEKIVNENEIQKAFKLIVLELAARHLIDYFEESYFKWENSGFDSSAEFNLARCRSQIEYYKDIERKLS